MILLLLSLFTITALYMLHMYVKSARSLKENVTFSQLLITDPGSTYTSSVSEQYKKIGAYFNRQTEKLEALRLPSSKVNVIF